MKAGSPYNLRIPLEVILRELNITRGSDKEGNCHTMVEGDNPSNERTKNMYRLPDKYFCI